jgi:hypothetical protein
MSWPVHIILPAEPVQTIKWKRWGYTLFLLLFSIMVGSWLLRITKIVESDNILNSMMPLTVITIGGYLIAFALRIYCYGICLSAHDAYLYEQQVLQERWTQWASKPLYIPASHFFLPSQIALSDIISGKSVDVAKGQALKLEVYDEIYTEENLLNELLSSVRAEIKKLSSSHIFDVIFTCEENYTSFPAFRECWHFLGIDEKVLGRFHFYKDSHEDIYEHVLNAEDNRIFIIVSIRVDSYQLSSADTTEYASILLMAKKHFDMDKMKCSEILRPMSCGKHSIENKFMHMRTYQPELLNSTRVFFSHLDQGDIVDVSDVLHKQLSSEENRWEFDAYDLNMVLGKLSGDHFWLVIALSLYFSEMKGESSFMVNKVGEQFVFNVIKPFDYHKESVN